MFTLLVTLNIITAILLILVVSVQGSKKEGLGSSLGSMGATQLMGIKKTSDLLEQITWGFIITLFTLSLATTIFLKRGHESSLPTSPNLERIQERNLLPEPNQESNQEDSTQSAAHNSPAE